MSDMKEQMLACIEEQLDLKRSRKNTEKFSLHGLTTKQLRQVQRFIRSFREERTGPSMGVQHDHF